MHDEAKRKFCGMLLAALRAHPEWLADAVAALNEGVLLSNEDLKAKLATAETALIMTYPLAKARLPEEQRQVVVAAIKQSRCYGDTPFARGLAVEPREKGET